jgi:phosphoribosylcarboxyaminoimidazole (NCAIR) mutase
MNADGSAIDNIDLSAAGVKVKVKITAAGSSEKLIGMTGDIEITLPVAKVDLNTITTIAAPDSITAAFPEATTKAELMIALDPQVLAAVQAKAPGAVMTTDYTYDVMNADGSAIDNIDLSAAGVKVKVKITAAGSSEKLTGMTGDIEITLPVAKPVAKVDLNTITTIAAEPVKLITLINRFSTKISPISLPLPLTALKTPAGIPALIAN